MQKDLAQSSKALLEAKLGQFGLGEAQGFKVYRDVIQTPGDGLMIFKGMNDFTAESIKSLEGFRRAWWEEAHTGSAHSLSLLRPTIRAPGSELWFSWNARRKTDPVDVMLRGPEMPTGAQVVQANWRDNPWFTAELEQERLDCLRMAPDQYDHVWEGGYLSVVSGAYFAQCLTDAKAQNRIGFFAADPLMTLRAHWDIGGTGAKADACAIWISQFIGGEVRVLDYYEAVGQPLSAHVAWLRSKGYEKAQCVLPHDGATHDKVHAVSYESALRQAQMDVRVIPNMGAGAANARIEAVRRLFPSIRFNAEATEAGRDALGWYHEKRDEARGIGLGPNHDWSSHCFTGDTLVRTKQGLVRFDSLPPTGLVCTPCGWKPYRNPRVTLANAPLVEVRFSDGDTVRCTPDHLFATGDGWKSASSLGRGSLILSTSTRSRSILTAACIGLGLARNTLVGAVSAFTGRFGQMLSGLFRPAAISTTGTGILSTIGSTTSNAWTGENTLASLGTKAAQRNAPSIFQPWRGIVPATGINRTKGVSGTSDMPNALSSGQRTSGLSARAKNAARSLWGWIAPLLHLKNTAHPLVSGKPTASLAKRTLMPLRIESVRHLSQRADVWDLTVPEIECFALGNGAIVHNSADAFGLMAIDHMSQPKPNSGPIPYKKLR